MKPVTYLIAATLIASGSTTFAETWTLDGQSSKLAFGSVKSEYVGEIHSFDALSGTVSRDGAVEITVELGSVNTEFDIRNERMIEHVFDFAPNALITGQIDMATLSELGVGETAVIPVEAQLSFLGTDLPVTPEMFVARIADDKVMVTTDSMVFVATDELEIDAGIDMLKEIAGLDTITRAVPITMRLMFQLSDTEA